MAEVIGDGFGKKQEELMRQQEIAKATKLRKDHGFVLNKKGKYVDEKKHNAAIKGQTTTALRNLLGVGKGTKLSESDIKNALDWTVTNFSEEELIKAGITDESRKLYGRESYAGASAKIKELSQQNIKKSIYRDFRKIDGFENLTDEEIHTVIKHEADQLRKVKSGKIDNTLNLNNDMLNKLGIKEVKQLSPEYTSGRINAFFEDIKNSRISRTQQAPKPYTMPSSETNEEAIARIRKEAQELNERAKSEGQVAHSQVTKSKPDSGADGKTSNKAKWGKRAGFMGVGMAVLGAAGLAVNSLMINDKGRLNNAQMYGQQPYSQY